jgi:hypothetical protein
MPNKWMTHVKKTMKRESSKKKSMGKGWFKHVLKSAKASYHKKGGGDSDPPVPKPEEEAPAKPEGEGMEGGKRRRSRRKTHRKRR